MCLFLPSLPGRGQTADNPAQAVQQGVALYQNGEFEAAIAPWLQALSYYEQSPNPAHEVVVRENLARAYLALGQTAKSIEQWQQVSGLYRELAPQQPDLVPLLGRSLTEQAQVYNRLGQYRKAVGLLCGAFKGAESCTAGSALVIAQDAADTLGSAAALGSLGQAHRLMGDYDLAMGYLEQARSQAQSLDDPTFLTATDSNLGSVMASQAVVRYRQANSADALGDQRRANDLRSQGQLLDAKAIDYFERSLASATQPAEQLRVLLDAIPPYDRVGDAISAQQARQTVQNVLTQLPDSQETVLATLDWVRLLNPVTPVQPFTRSQCLKSDQQSQGELFINRAVAMAEQIDDRRSLSFALGELGHLEECRGALVKALELTQQARSTAENEFDSRYLWEWQSGRILSQQDQPSEAIKAYEQSIATLETIRDDILIASRDVQFDFRDTIDPIYRQLVDLRLKQGPSSVLLPVAEGADSNRSALQAPSDDPAQTFNSDLNQVLLTLDSLKLAELQNYFGNDCVLTALNIDLSKPQELVKRDERAAVISTVILDDRTSVILTLPDGRRQFEEIPLDRARLIETVNTYRKDLEVDYLAFDPRRAQLLYDYLIRPFELVLAQTEIDTLVFVQDGIFRSVPMAALYDGRQFLVQKYAIATTPSLQLTALEELDRRNLRALAVGLTQETGQESESGFFPALPNVAREIRAVETELPDSETLLNGQFRLDALKDLLSSDAYPIVHIATHGIFGTESDDTFLVTGETPNNKLTLNELDTLLRSVDPDRPVELLSLTACTTAIGDDRAALGLAGVAAQAGVGSVVASLWFVSDAPTAQLVEEFYANLKNPQLSKAKALQQAQLALIDLGKDNLLLEDFAKPAFWASFVLVGNWL